MPEGINAERRYVLGVGFDDLTPEQAYDRVSEYMSGKGTRKIFTPNPEFLLQARKDHEFMDILNSGDMVIADGIGVIICSKITGAALKKRVRGIDLVLSILKAPPVKPLSVYILGSTEGNCCKAAENISKDYRDIVISGYRNGYFGSEEEPAVVESIRKAGPDLLLAALGSPKQERFIEKHLDSLGETKCAIGVGGTVDILSGNKKLAPKAFRRIGLEWLYRTITEPRRIKRTFRLPLVIFYAVFERIRKAFS